MLAYLRRRVNMECTLADLVPAGTLKIGSSAPLANVNC